MLARLLAPDDFGLLAFALAYITYVTAIGDLGTGTALIYWPSRNDDAPQVTFVISVGTALLCLGGTILLAPAIAAFFGNPAGAPVLIAIAWSVPIQALGSTHDALCRKSLRFRAWFVPELALAAVRRLFRSCLRWVGLGSGAWSGGTSRAICSARFSVGDRARGDPPDHSVGHGGPMFADGRSIVASTSCRSSFTIRTC